MLTLTDMFCGAGGSSTGATMVPGIEVRVATNHWDLAIETHNTNHQQADHVCADVSQIDPRYFPTSDILWASPECTNHSVAKGVRRSARQPDLFGDVLPDAAAERSRATMWDVPRFAEHHQYKLIITENVVDAARWLMWDAWLLAMDSLGYDHHVVYLNSMHAQAFGDPAPQSRDRMYVVFWIRGNRRPDFDQLRPKAYCGTCDEVVSAVQSWKKPRPWGRYRAQYVWRCPRVACRNAVVEPGWLPAASIIDWDDLGVRIGDRPKPLAEKTMRRIQAGIDRYWGGSADPLVVNHVSGADSARSSRVMEPTPTMVAGGMHASLLVPTEGRDGKAAKVAGDPLRTQTTRNETAMVHAPFLTQFRDRVRDLDPQTEPLNTVVSDGANYGMVSPALVAEAAGNTFDAASPQHPAHGRADGYYRVWPGEDPLRTVHTTASKAAIFPPFIAELRGGGSDARPAADPLATVTASGNHHALVMRNNSGGAEMSTPVEEPARTITTGGHQSLISGGTVAIEDCMFRMFKPSEIKRAMAFASGYVLLGNKREQVRMAGNAVTPPAARDLIRIAVESLVGTT